MSIELELELEAYAEDDCMDECHLVLKVFGNRFELPALIKPYVFTHHFKKTWEDGAPEASYQKTASRRYGFYLFDNHFNVMWGIQGDMHFEFSDEGLKEKRWSCFLPWAEWKFIRHTVFNPDSTVYAEADHTHVDFDVRDETPTIDFTFNDYDGENLSVKTYIEEREWSRGVGWFGWLRCFFTNKVSRCLNLEFSGEVGKGKGSWKGGTLGHGIEMLNVEESNESAFKRYCKEHNLAYKGKSQ